jgi:SAM-dependent MidA family methyltransferase
MTYRGHSADGSPGAPYRDIGARDITAHVDTTTLARLLREAGFEVLGETTQAELLAGCGLEDLLERERNRATDVPTLLLLRSAVMRLLDPRHLGGFRAVLAGRGFPFEPPLRGLARHGASGRLRGA